ncbi:MULTISPECIES: hypothetical protein [Burkholderia]|uniref:hypothetical protein n=2 Tax=Burkholderiaceae TaxID=119060 RepID=UPI000F599975|nr:MULTISPECIES: hypothetical protein [Burkholderia]MBR8030013.1 hypothetical protein [Burkholderia cenocepacia]RQR62894.1 hypothetical protein DIE12_34495 [Burkholderia sp. Bp9015]
MMNQTIDLADVRKLADDGYTIVEYRIDLPSPFVVVADPVACMSGIACWKEWVAVTLRTRDQVMRFLLARS